MALPTNERANPADIAPEKLPWTPPELIDLSSRLDDVLLAGGPGTDAGDVSSAS